MSTFKPFQNSNFRKQVRPADIEHLSEMALLEQMGLPPTCSRLRVCQNTDGLCHSERSEESVNISKYIKYTLSDSSLRSE